VHFRCLEIIRNHEKTLPKTVATVGVYCVAEEVPLSFKLRHIGASGFNLLGV
jgi:hypothetical protein